MKVEVLRFVKDYKVGVFKDYLHKVIIADNV